ncbi:MAG: GNAT family N-acetyltransferase [Acidimicrobiia bacterium]|nr:GNAT family N-acetyltransferase [Acidimicrobiia bacterium]MDH5420301.1 GNAT family N-acetyltransferase [Acidimicrobiia bacterium]MDH5503762.1 GNAT family N-acetyltransferase [Acidimicrobiia bacterium]
MDIRNVSVEDFLVWPDDQPDDAEAIKALIDAGRAQPDWFYVGYLDGRPSMRIGYRTSPFLANPAHSGTLSETRLFAVGREGTEHTDEYRAFIDATLPSGLPDDVRLLETRLRESKHADAETRATQLEEIGFRCLMEKTGYVRSGGELPPPRPGIHFKTVEDVGRDAFTRLIAIVGGDGLDREMAHYQSHMDIQHWAEEHVRYLGDQNDLLMIGYLDGRPIGLVGLNDPGAEPYLSFIGVVPDQRGNGYVDDLVRHGTNVAIERGWNPLRAETDMGNLPMRRSFERCGYRMEPGTRLWGHLLDI